MLKNVNSYDYLRVITIYSVVLLHTTAPLLYLFNTTPTHDWITGNVFGSIVRWCVPIFFMLSGTFLLDPNKNETIKDFFKKRLNKILIPLLSWSVIYYFYSVHKEGHHNSLGLFLKRFINGDIYYHLWFLYILIGLYIVTPFLRAFIKHANRDLLKYFLIIWFIGTPLFNLINHLFKLKIFIDIPIDDYLGYFVLGYFLRTNEVSKKVTKTIYVLAIISLGITFFGTYHDTANNSGQFAGFYYGYLSPNTTIISVALFLLFKSFNTLTWKVNNVVSFINERSFGIYLIHVLVLKILLNEFNFGVSSFSPLISIPLVSVFIFVLSCISVYILQKIPYIRRII